MAEFHITRLRAVTLVLRDASGQLILPGAVVTHIESQQQLVVGYDGQVFVEHPALHNHLEVTTSEYACTAEFDFPASSRDGAAIAFTCSVTSPGTQNFGNISPVSGLSASATGAIGVSCTVGFLEGLSNGTRIRACLSIGGASGSNPRLLANGANNLQYSLYSDSAHTQIIGSSAAAPPSPVSIDFDLGLLGMLLDGTASQNVPLYAYLPASLTSAPAGAYSQSFSGSNALLNYTSYVGAAPTCSAAWTSGGLFPVLRLRNRDQ